MARYVVCRDLFFGHDFWSLCIKHAFPPPKELCDRTARVFFNSLKMTLTSAGKGTLRLWPVSG